ncbi:hypothetical protein PTQ46_01445 [Klebsiella michiganensis]|uniref:hypothetical protein n=1 Tax=Klebsiella TaxID=570 RepID=UPI001315570F|nr:MULTISPECIES: hypothetical protein [Klebsiella]GJK93458.1 hypothetical protein TUM17568_46640 [Klebsiella oxytoca]MDS7838880.1 hypothetical protein [Klebsiella michiganensis]MDW5638034.1 hypothetical protein [Klebsiella pneumoniae]MEE1968005.1 hypothetical protein [Klebsiella michiganensis]HBC6351200.1 hypothetical protein [Klebsiella oxytoca]
MSDKKQSLTMEQQEFIFRTKAELLAELIKFQIPGKSEAEELAEVVNAAFDKLTA